MKGHRTKQSIYEQVHRSILADAVFLLRHGRWHSATYLGGYALECLLKVAICAYLNLRKLPRQYEVHDLAFLLDIAALGKELLRDQKIEYYFRRVTQVWRVELRYSGKLVTGREAERFFECLDEVLILAQRTNLKAKIMSVLGSHLRDVIPAPYSFYVQVVPTELKTHLHVCVISDFYRKTPNRLKRDDGVWDTLMPHLSPNERLKIGMISCWTKEEALYFPFLNRRQWMVDGQSNRCKAKKISTQGLTSAGRLSRVRS